MENRERRYREWIRENPGQRPSPFAGLIQRELYEFYCQNIHRAELIAKEVEKHMVRGRRFVC